MAVLSPENDHFDEPTRGIDVGAKAEIYKVMRQLADDGKVILMVSSELPEIITVCDRIAVFCEGRLTQILTNRDDMAKRDYGMGFTTRVKASEREETVQLCAVLG